MGRAITGTCSARFLLLFFALARRAERAVVGAEGSMQVFILVATVVLSLGAALASAAGILHLVFRLMAKLR